MIYIYIYISPTTKKNKVWTIFGVTFVLVLPSACAIPWLRDATISSLPGGPFPRAASPCDTVTPPLRRSRCSWVPQSTPLSPRFPFPFHPSIRRTPLHIFRLPRTAPTPHPHHCRSLSPRPVTPCPRTYPVRLSPARAIKWPRQHQEERPDRDPRWLAGDLSNGSGRDWDATVDGACILIDLL